MKKTLNVLIMVGVAVVALAIGFCAYVYVKDVLSVPRSNPASVVSSLPTESLTVGNAHLTVEVATTPAEQEFGLSYRNSLAPEAGMLFTFATASRQGFWMKGMNFPLDFIYSRAGRVVQLKENVSSAGIPVPFFPDEDIDSVIEVNAGWIVSHGIKVGDKVVSP
jgi:uncharacterized membrane protein (UPF0127 family)